MPTSVIMMEVAHTTTKTRDVLLLADIERTWNAVGRVLRHHLLHGHSVSLAPRTLSFAMHTKLVAHDQGSKYHVREPFFGAHPTYATQFGLTNDVPRESAKADVKRLPLDMVANEAKLPADVCAYAIREMFLYIGEAVYNHKLVQLELPGVCNVLLKRDRAAVAYDAQFVADLWQIDSRKWPAMMKAAIADARDGVIPVIGAGGFAAAGRDGRPSSAGSAVSSARLRSASRPTSAGSRSPSNPAGAAGHPVEEARPTFVSAAKTGRNFSEIKKDKPRSLPVPARGERRGPLKPKAANAVANGACAQVTAMSPAHFSTAGDDEEESVYALASPNRDRDVASDAVARSEAPEEEEVDVAFPFPARTTVGSLNPAALAATEEGTPGPDVVPEPEAHVQWGRPSSGVRSHHHHHTPLWGPHAFEEAPKEAAVLADECPHHHGHGRRRIAPAHEGYSVANLLKDPSPRRFPAANPALYDNIA